MGALSSEVSPNIIKPHNHYQTPNQIQSKFQEPHKFNKNPDQPIEPNPDHLTQTKQTKSKLKIQIITQGKDWNELMQLAMTNNCHKGCSYVQDTDRLSLAQSIITRTLTWYVKRKSTNPILCQLTPNPNQKPPLNPYPKHKTYIEPQSISNPTSRPTLTSRNLP